jgi:hypothetical protein
MGGWAEEARMLDFGLPPQESFAQRGDRGNGFARLFIEGELDLSAVPSFEVNLQSAAGRALEDGRQLELVNRPPSVERMFGSTGNQHLLRNRPVSELIGNSVEQWSPIALPQEVP